MSELQPAEMTDDSEKYHFGIWARPQASDMGTYAFNISKSVIREFGNYLNFPFGKMHPYLKNDHVAVPDFDSGAMENWGLVTYKYVFFL